MSFNALDLKLSGKHVEACTNFAYRPIVPGKSQEPTGKQKAANRKKQKAARKSRKANRRK